MAVVLRTLPVYALLLSSLSPAVITGQSTSTATVVGTVTDPTGAVMSDVRVTAMNPETRLSREASTGPDGVYRLDLLPPGVYELRAVHPGFATLVRHGVSL